MSKRHPEVLRSDPARLVRLGLLCLARELAPEADDMAVIVDGEVGWSCVRHRGRAEWVRWPGFDRCHECRRRLGRLVRGAYPDAVAASAVFYRAGEFIAALDLLTCP